MSNAWDDARQRAKESSDGNGLFVKLKNDGDSFVGVFLGDPHVFDVVWNGETFLDASAPEGITAIENGNKKQTKFAINVYVPSEKDVKIWQMNASTFEALDEVNQKYGADTWAFEVKRRGAARNPKTTYSILPETQLNSDQQAALKSKELHDLGAICGGDPVAPKASHGGDDFGDDDIPF